jgi:hypothetical protein
MWQDHYEKREKGESFIGWEGSFIPMTLTCFGYQIFNLDNCAIKLYTETGLKSTWIKRTAETYLQVKGNTRYIYERGRGDKGCGSREVKTENPKECGSNSAFCCLRRIGNQQGFGEQTAVKRSSVEPSFSPSCSCHTNNRAECACSLRPGLYVCICAHMACHGILYLSILVFCENLPIQLQVPFLGA